jgi:flagellar basal-body rod protein FlgB
MNKDPTIELIGLALDTGLMRQTAIANNIANANTQGYQALEVNFEQQLTNLDFSAASDSLQTIKPFYQSGDNSAIDEQIALSVKNATHYRALIKGLNQKLALMKLALHGNNQS